MLHKRLWLVWVTLLIALPSIAQDAQKEINEQVWKPFIASFNKQDAYGFLGVHSKDLTRSARDSKKILNWDEYYAQQSEQMNRKKSDGIKNELELHFTERISNSKQAIDVGVYKTSTSSKDGKTDSHYGRFLVVLRKENGIWKILVDTDSSEGNTITEKDFLAAKAM